MRFTAQVKAKESQPPHRTVWTVVDNQAKNYNMPSEAVTIGLSQKAAEIIAKELNTEWRSFLADPW